MHLKEIEYEVVDCIFLAEAMHQWWALVSTVMKLRIP
jgi:hypothetical protein